MKIAPLPICLTFLSLSAATGSAYAQAPDAAAAARRELLQKAGVAAPLTLYAPRVLDRPDANVAEALGLVLERYGMSDLQVAVKVFTPGDVAWEAVPALFAAHVKQAVGEGEPKRHHLYAQFLGDPRRGPTEVRFVVADATGAVAMLDRQTPADATFQRTAGRDPDPLGCSTLVAERLFELAGWQKVPGGVRGGKFAERWRLRSGAPDQNERAAIARRLDALRTRLAEARIAVLPPLWQPAPDGESAKRIADRLREQLGCQATVVAAVAPLEVAPSANQQKRLWDLAAALRVALGRQPIDGDYALAADMGLSPDGKKGFVNVVVLTKAGEVVVADFQNDQHPLFQAEAPKALQDGEKFAVARLRQLLR